MNFTMYHSCISVFDLEASVAFYEKALGLKPQRQLEGDDYKIVFMGTEGGPCQLELNWQAGREQPYNLGDNQTHLGFRVDDFEKAKQYHEERGLISMENPNFGVYFLKDPDGYLVEIVPTR